MRPLTAIYAVFREFNLVFGRDLICFLITSDFSKSWSIINFNDKIIKEKITQDNHIIMISTFCVSLLLFFETFRFISFWESKTDQQQCSRLKRTD